MKKMKLLAGNRESKSPLYISLVSKSFHPQIDVLALLRRLREFMASVQITFDSPSTDTFHYQLFQKEGLDISKVRSKLGCIFLGKQKDRLMEMFCEEGEKSKKLFDRNDLSLSAFKYQNYQRFILYFDQLNFYVNNFNYEIPALKAVFVGEREAGKFSLITILSTGALQNGYKQSESLASKRWYIGSRIGMDLVSLELWVCFYCTDPSNHPAFISFLFSLSRPENG